MSKDKKYIQLITLNLILKTNSVILTINHVEVNIIFTEKFSP